MLHLNVYSTWDRSDCALAFFWTPKLLPMPAFLRAPKLSCPVLHQAGQLTGTRTHFQIGVARHAKWTGTNDESDLTGSTSHDFSPFFCILISAFTGLDDNFSLAFNCSTRRDAVRNNGASHRDCVRSCGSYCLRRQLSVLFSSTGWGKKQNIW